MSIKNQIIIRIYILLNLFVWVLPNFDAVDTIGPQWLYLSILNILGLYLVFRFRAVEKLQNIFMNPLIIAFIALGVWASLSFIYAANDVEVLIESGRLFTLIILLINFSCALFIEKNRMRFLSSVLVIYLGIEVLMMLAPTYIVYGTFVGLDRSEIFKGIAANINITAFSILFKIPFVLLLFKELDSKFIKVILFFLLVSSFFCISLLGTRAAILGSFLIIIISTIYSLVFLRNRIMLFKSSIFVISLLAPFLFNKIINMGSDNDVFKRFSTLENSNDGSINERLSYYKLSVENLFENPLIGMGYGNWKIESIPYALNGRTYTVPYHSHNDFLQIGAELGLMGLILYVFIFCFAFYMVYQLYNKAVIDKLQAEALLLFLTVYLLDANINFPISRVIIQTVLLFVLSFLVVEYSVISNISLRFKYFKNMWLIILLISPFLIYSNYKVFKSFQQQRKLLADFNTRQFNADINEIKNFEVEYPNIGVTALPLKAMIANYYSIVEPEKAIELALKGSKDNPYLFLGEVVASRIYSNQGDLINAKKYAKKAYENAPTIEIHAATYLPFIRNEKNTDELEKINRLIKKSNSKYIWQTYFSYLLNSKSSMTSTDKELLQTGVNRFPEFKALGYLNLMKEYSKQELSDAILLGNEGDNEYDKKNFLIAAKKYKQANSIIPTEKAYVENIAKSYMGAKKFDESINYFNKLITEFGDISGMPEYYIGVMYYAQNEIEKSCEILLKSMEKNFSNARKFYNSVCLKN